jgi:hypothetical protein
MKAVDERIESKGIKAAMAILRKTLRQVADWKVAKINGYALRVGKNGGALYQIAGSKILPKGIQPRIINKLLGSMLGSERYRFGIIRDSEKIRG